MGCAIFVNGMHPVSFIALMCSMGNLHDHIASGALLHDEWMSTLTLTSAISSCLHVYRSGSSGIRALEMLPV